MPIDVGSPGIETSSLGLALRSAIRLDEATALDDATTLAEVTTPILVGTALKNASGAQLATLIKSSLPGWVDDFDTAMVQRTSMFGQQADMDGSGKGGINIGGGFSNRGVGSWITSDGHGNWNHIKSAKNYNPTEFAIYNSTAYGEAVTVIGTNQITRLQGSNFQASWVGRTLYFLRKKFKIASYIDANTITVTETNGNAVVFATADSELWQYCYTTGSGTCSVAGTVVTWISGDPFVPLFFRDFVFKLGATEVTVAAFTSVNNITLSAPPGDGVYNFSYSGDIFDQTSTLRIQAIAGAYEENLAIAARAGDNFYGRHYFISAQGGDGYTKYRPIYIGSGSFGAYLPRHQIGVYPEDATAGHNGYVGLGGVQNLDSLRVYSRPTMVAGQFLRVDPVATGSPIGIQADGASDANIDAFVAGKGTGRVRLANQQPNYLQANGAAAGYTPAFRAQGADTNIAFGVDAKGTGAIVFTQDFARTLARFTSTASAVNYLEFSTAITGNRVSITAKGTDTDVSAVLVPKGAGSIALKDSSWNSKVEANATGIGFYGATPAAKPSITGSRNSNAALASLITQLATLGLLTDTTTA
jgi:hypothetical protein